MVAIPPDAHEFKPEELKVRIACVLLEEGRILLAKHKREGREYWTLPGGGLERGETMAACLRREMWEESGLEIEVGDILFLFDVIEPRRQVVNIVFRARRVGGELKPNNIPLGQRLVGMEFIPLDKLDDIELLPPIAKEIEKSLKRQGIPYLGDLWGK